MDLWKLDNSQFKKKTDFATFAVNKKLKSKVEGKEIRFADNIVIGGWGFPFTDYRFQASTNLRGKERMVVEE